MKIPGNERADKIVDECAKIIADSVMNHGFRELRGVVYQLWQILATETERSNKERKKP